MATTPGLKLDYEGSVKNVFVNPSEPNYLWFQFTDDYSVFDWGKMPDQIANKGQSLTLLGAYLFSELAKPNVWAVLPESPHLKKFDAQYLNRRWQHPTFSGKHGLKEIGLASHFVDLVNTNLKPLAVSADALSGYGNVSTLLKVLGASVSRPTQRTLFGQNIYFYDPENLSKPIRRLIPLEVVFRFGMGEGSSLTKRLNDHPGYAQQLGFAESPLADQWFDHPVVEFFTKLEPKDRFLSWQEASLLSGLPEALFEQLIELAVDIGLMLHHLFAERGLELWDGKLEFVLEPSSASTGQEAHLLLADSIGPDELRLIYRGQQISKEFIRQYYRGTSWAKALQKAHEIAGEQSDQPWREICLNDLKEVPAPLSPQVKAVVDKLYGVLANHIIGQAIFDGQPTLEQLVVFMEPSMLAGEEKIKC